MTVVSMISTNHPHVLATMGELPQRVLLSLDRAVSGMERETSLMISMAEFTAAQHWEARGQLPRMVGTGTTAYLFLPA